MPLYLIALLVCMMSCTVACAAELRRLLINLDQRFQTIDHFAASDCWSIQKLDSWSEQNRNRLADLLFSTDKGIGLSMWRFNIGGGINTATIRDPWRTVETFEVAEGQYDWSRQAGQRWFLAAAKARGVNKFLAFVNSPPGRMTRSGLTNAGLPQGGQIEGSTNLKPGFEPQFAKYLADILEHFARHPDPSQQIVFQWISPVNEPALNWDRGQEGNRAGNDDIVRIVKSLHAELSSRKLPTRILVPEANVIHDLYRTNERASREHGTLFGDYFDFFAADPQLGPMLGFTLAYHAYGSDGPDQLVPPRQRLRAKLQEHPGWTVWQSEYCVLSSKRDLGMDTALNVARLIHCDLTIANASAWGWWLALSPYDYKDGLIYTDWKKPGDEETIIPSKLLWALGNFSRYVRPGMQRVAIESPNINQDLDGLLVSAYHLRAGGRLAIVCINMSAKSALVQVQLRSGGQEVPVAALRPHVTSANEADDLKACPPVAGADTIQIPARSIVTITATTP
jgi:hypothetical protein